MALQRVLGDAPARNGEDYEGLQLLDGLWGARAPGLPPPLSPRAISALCTRAAREGDGACAVCLEPQVAPEAVMVLPCTHVFHSMCAEPWLQRCGACPQCRFKFLELV